MITLFENGYPYPRQVLRQPEMHNVQMTYAPPTHPMYMFNQQPQFVPPMMMPMPMIQPWMQQPQQFYPPQQPMQPPQPEQQQNSPVEKEETPPEQAKQMGFMDKTKAFFKNPKYSKYAKMAGIGAGVLGTLGLAAYAANNGLLSPGALTAGLGDESEQQPEPVKTPPPAPVEQMEPNKTDILQSPKRPSVIDLVPKKPNVAVYTDESSNGRNQVDLGVMIPRGLQQRNHIMPSHFEDPRFSHEPRYYGAFGRVTPRNFANSFYR